MTKLPVAVLVAAALTRAAGAADVQTVALVVTDAQGAFVPDIRTEEVRVLENGEPREVTSFLRDERPLAVALVVDTSTGATQVFRAQAFEAVSSFLARLPEGSRCVLWATGDHARKIGELKGGRAEVEKRVAQGFGFGGPNALLDALVEAAEGLGRETGRRRAIVAVSGGGSGHTSQSPSQIAAQVRRARARVLGVLYREGESGAAGPLRGLDAPRDVANLSMVGATDHERVLLGLAQGTGGRFESIPAALGVSGLLEALAAELGGQYRVCYAAAVTKGPRRVDVQLARTGVRWRVAVDSP